MVRFFYFCMLFCFPFSYVVSKSYFHADTLRMNKKTYYTVSEAQKSNLVKYYKNKVDTVFNFSAGIKRLAKHGDEILISTYYPIWGDYFCFYYFKDRVSVPCLSDVFLLRNDEVSVVKNLADVYPVTNSVSDIIIEMKGVDCVRTRDRQVARYKCKDGNFVKEKVEASGSFMGGNSLYRLPNIIKGDDVKMVLDALFITEGTVKSFAEIGIGEKDIRVFKERFLKNVRNHNSDEFKMVSDINYNVNVDELCSYADSLSTISADFINLALNRELYFNTSHKSVSIDFVFSDGEKLSLFYSGRENSYMDSPFNVSYKSLSYVAKSFDFYRKLREVTNGCLLSDDETLDKNILLTKVLLNYIWYKELKEQVVRKEKEQTK